MKGSIKETFGTVKEKTGNWFKEHAIEIAIPVSLLITWATSSIVTELQIARGLEKFHKAGYMKFFDDAGKEIGIGEAVKIVNKMI